MNGNWLRRTCLSLLALGACGSGKFSEDYASEIQQDCIATIACDQTGQIESCIEATGALLDDLDLPQQQYFIDTVYRCQNMLQCDYKNCTQSTAQAGYAAAHVAQISYDCEQRWKCRNASGQPPTAAIQSCIEETGNRLNANPQEQAAYDAHYARCQSFAGCSYGACQ